MMENIIVTIVVGLKEFIDIIPIERMRAVIEGAIKGAPIRTEEITIKNKEWIALSYIWSQEEVGGYILGWSMVGGKIEVKSDNELLLIPPIII